MGGKDLADVAVGADAFAVACREISVFLLLADLVLVDRNREGLVVALADVVATLPQQEGILIFDADADTRKLHDKHRLPLFMSFITIVS